MAEAGLLAGLELVVRLVLVLVLVLVHVLQEVRSQGRREWMRKIGVDHNTGALNSLLMPRWIACSPHNATEQRVYLTSGPK